MGLTLTAKIGLLLILPFVSSLVGVLGFASYLHRTRTHGHFINISGRQRMHSVELRDWAHMVSIGQEEDRAGLKSRVQDFERALATLEHGGQVLGDNVDPAPPEVRPALESVASLWSELQPDLLAIAETPRDDAQFVDTYRRVEERLPELLDRSNRVVAAFETLHQRQRRGILLMLECIAGINVAVILAGIFLTRRYIARPVVRTEERLGAQARRSERRFQEVVEHATDGIVMMGKDGLISHFNRTAERMFGHSRDNVLGRPLTILMPETYRDNHEKGLAHFLATGEGKVLGQTLQIEGLRKDGSVFPIELTISVYRSDGDMVFTGVLRDITERRQMEDRLFQSQKMESIGRLTGGVAHDFNNLLGIITGYCELTLQGLKPDDPVREYLKDIKEAGERATTLTRQLLAFGRKQVLRPKAFNLNTVLGRADRMLQRLIGEDITMLTVPDPELGLVKADPHQIEQVIFNLATNARDAMPQGGTLTFETKNVTLDQQYADRHPEVQAGPYVLVAVSDTGTGMDAKTLSHIFEPFFTTKKRKGGTGMGLSMAYGIVKQSGGHISVDSAPGKGTSFMIYLPRVAGEAERVRPEATLPAYSRGWETVMVVEDEGKLRKLICQILKEKGYTVLEASSGTEALQAGESFKEPIALLVTDVIMPGIDGRETAALMALKRPDIKVLHISGFTSDAIAHHGVLKEGVHFLEKPFTPEVLARRVRELLDTK